MTFIYLFVLFLLIIVDIQPYISFKCTTQWFTDTEVYFCSSLQNRRHIIFNMHKKRTKKILLCTCTDVISVPLKSAMAQTTMIPRTAALIAPQTGHLPSTRNRYGDFTYIYFLISFSDRLEVLFFSL